MHFAEIVEIKTSEIKKMDYVLIIINNVKNIESNWCKKNVKR